MTTEAQPQFDAERAEDFAGQLMTAVNGASLVFFAALGKDTGLFEVMAGMDAATSDDIARAAGLDERYVREWLGGMVLAKVIDYEPSAKTYRLPAEHAAFLTRAGGPNNLTVITQFFPYMGILQEKVVEAFRTGRGVPYEAFPRFQEIQDETTRAYIDTALVEGVLPLVDGLTDRLRSGATALDIGCGAGHAVNVLAEAYAGSSFTGYDFSEEGIALARKEAAAKGLPNAHFEVRDIALPGDESKYDLVTAIEVVHDLARPNEVLSGVYRALKPGGVFLVIDINASSNLEDNFEHPIGTSFFAFSVYHCMSVSLAQDGAGLGTMVGEQKVTELLRNAGFASVEVKHMENDFIYSYYIARK